jgi:hypothetical protein
MGKVVEWLESRGLSVDDVARSRNWVVLSGTVAQVQAAFRTEIRRYRVDGEEHFANATEPSIPAALENIVLGIRGLDDFRPMPRNKVRPLPLSDPRFTGPGGGHLLAPGDIGTIYNVNPLYSRGINGNGQKLVVVGQTDVALSDIRFFRQQFGLPANDPQMVLVAGSSDPGTSKNDLSEANLDLDWTGAVAPNASIIYVNSTNIYNSVQYAIDQNLAPVISMSYGYCEPKISSSPASSAAFFRSLAQQANASGITWLASSGDNAAADCDSGASATTGLSVDLPASVPEVTGVGGTEFNEGSGNFWNNPPNNANGGSAISYIPEMVWNDTASRKVIIGGGGGASMFFTKPLWQTGPGVPTDGVRDVPDVSFAASPDHDGYYFAVNGVLQVVGGTSVATPVFAGMISLLNQSQVANGAKAGLGNINPTLYALAQSTPNVFHDVTVGNNIVPCTAGSPNCVNGSLGFSAGAGYDRATGLGSVDASNLVAAWSGRTTSGTTTTFAANPASILMSASTVLTATVRAATGTTTPTGSVSFTVNTTALGSANLTPSTAGIATATLTVPGSQLAVGANVITASYSGNAGFNASSGTVTVTVSLPTLTSSIVPSLVPSPVYQQTDSNGQAAWFFTVRLTELAGVATTLTDFTFNGQPLASQIQNFFGTASIPAHGTLSTALVASNLTVPATILLTFSGVDGGGQKWSQQISVPFFGRQLSASMALSSSPTTLHQNPNGDPNCAKGTPFYQQMNLQEQNGYGVNLTRFVANGTDSTSSIAKFFGSVRLAPLGMLKAGICWTGIVPPATVSFEIDGTDTNGNKISATASVPFLGPVSGGALSVSKSSVVLAANPNGTVTANLSALVQAAQDWTASVYPANQTTSWLTMSPWGPPVRRV